MPQRELSIRSDEAVARAAELSRRLNRTLTDVVVDALRAYEEALQTRDSDGLTAEQRQEHLDFLDFVRSLQPHVVPGASSDHRDLYDEVGLPR